MISDTRWHHKKQRRVVSETLIARDMRIEWEVGAKTYGKKDKIEGEGDKGIMNVGAGASLGWMQVEGDELAHREV